VFSCEPLECNEDQICGKKDGAIGCYSKGIYVYKKCTMKVKYMFIYKVFTCSLFSVSSFKLLTVQSICIMMPVALPVPPLVLIEMVQKSAHCHVWKAACAMQVLSAVEMNAHL